MLKKTQMKYLYIYLSIIIIGICSCEKIDLQNDLEGKWKVLGSSGGIGGSGVTPNYTHLEFHKKKYIVSNNEDLIEEGSYSISKIEDSHYSSRMVWQISYNPKINYDRTLKFYTNNKMGIIFEGPDTLTLSELYFTDGFCYHFKREK
jgi:hypothetical protein